MYVAGNIVGLLPMEGKKMEEPIAISVVCLHNWTPFILCECVWCKRVRHRYATKENMHKCTLFIFGSHSSLLFASILHKRTCPYPWCSRSKGRTETMRECENNVCISRSVNSKGPFAQISFVLSIVESIFHISTRSISDIRHWHRLTLFSLSFLLNTRSIRRFMDNYSYRRRRSNTKMKLRLINLIIYRYSITISGIFVFNKMFIAKHQSKLQ